MECGRCGANLGPGVRECPDCGNRIYGNDFVYASITVSWEEARKGGVQTVEMRNLQNPLRIRLKPRTRTGDKIRVAGAMFRQADDSVLLAPVEVTVHVERRPLWQPVMAVLLCLLLLGGAGVGIWALAAELEIQPAQQVSATLPDQTASPTTQTTPTTTQPIEATVQETTEPEATATETTEPETTEPETTEPETTEPDTQAEQGRSSIIMNYELRPLLQQLSDEHFAVVEAMYQALMNFESSVTPPCEVTVEEMDHLIQILRCECPELMQFDISKGGTYYYNTTTNMVNTYEFPYAMSRAEYTDMYDACAEVIDRLVSASQGMTDWEKERYVFDYITSNCTYSMDPVLAGTAYGTLVEKTAKCDGISFAVKWIMEEMDIPCIVVCGDPTEGTIGHAWNYVLLDGEYYGLDVTQDVPGEEGGATLFAAYNVSTEWVEQTYILCSFYSKYVQTPVVTTMEKSYHVQNGSYMATGADWRSYLQAEFLNACQNGGEFRLQFENAAEFETCTAEINQLCNDAFNSGNISEPVSWQCWYKEGYNVIYVGVTKG